MENKVILITGGSGLLGSEMIRYINSKGAITLNLDINCIDNWEKGTLYCDVTSDKSIIEVVAKIINKYKHIHGLVNNAYPRTKDWGASFEEIEPQSWRTNLDWQLNSYFLISQQVIKQMRVQGFGSIVNIASIYGVVGNDFAIYEGTSIKPAAAYTAIKGGLINLTRFLASQYGKYNVRINCVSPGGIFDNQPELFVKAYEKKTPMKRMGQPDDIAPAVSFLLSEEAKYITGQNLIVDGGWTSI
jgi:NAD(P)-dependent dehydrogenase (short-subunit alcohol dehydrogenase family)